METQPRKEFANMHEVVMRKDALLTALITNKAKHDVVLATAISGYWDLAKERLLAKRKALDTQMTEWKEDADKEFTRVANKIDKKETLPSYLSIKTVSVNGSLDLVYPEDHSKDYERAIRMMEASIYDEVKLSTEEFDAYVLNNWEWRNNFLAANTVYVDSFRGKYNTMAISGCSVPTLTGSYLQTYNNAFSIAANGFAGSGIGAF